MKKLQSLLAITALFAASHLSARTADDLIAAGRTLLATNDDEAAYANLPAAYADFNQAVLLSPTNEAANALAGVTRLLVLAQQPAASNALNRLGVSRQGRDVLNWTAYFTTNKSGQVVLPANLNSTEAFALLTTNVMPAVRASLTNLDRITNRAFTLSLASDETHVRDVTLDWGDIELMRAVLHAAEFATHTLNAHNFSAVITHLESLRTAKPSQLTVQKVLADYPSLLALTSKSELAASKAPLIDAITHYLAASEFIRDTNNRPPDVGLFDLSPDEAADEATFRDALTNALASLDHPVSVVSNSTALVYAGPYFAGTHSLRSLLPKFSGNLYVSNSLPDYTFGGVLLDEPAYLTEALLRQKLDPSPYAGIYIGQLGQEIDFPLTVVPDGGGFALFVNSHQQATLIAYGPNLPTSGYSVRFPVSNGGGWQLITNGIVNGGSINQWGDGIALGGMFDLINGEIWDNLLGTLVSQAGAFQNDAGCYSGTWSGGGKNGKLCAILSADGQLVYCHFSSGGQSDDGGSGQLDANNHFTFVSLNGVTVAGMLNPKTFKITGTFAKGSTSGTVALTRSDYIPQDTPPAITTLPLNQAVTNGGKATFKVAVAGSPPLCYQWSFNGVPIEGATFSNLVLSNLQSTNAGTYFVAIQNIAGSNSASAVLMVEPDPVSPTLTITSPKPGQRSTNPAFSVTGTAKDNVQVSNVWCQLNNADPVMAAGTTSWTNWVTLTPGTNLVRACAQDTSGNLSLIRTGSVIYLVSNRLTLAISPPNGGTVSGAANGQWLDINLAYTATAKPNTAKGFGFQNWTLTANGTDWATSSVPALFFTMRPNLALQANFVDVQAPNLKITAPTPNQRWSNAVFTVKGTAKDNLQVANVWCLTNGVWGLANSGNGWTNWTMDVALVPGTNTVWSYAEDRAGNRSPTNSVSVDYVVTNILTVTATGPGTLSPNYNNQWLEIGRSYNMTVTPGAGYILADWEGTVQGNLVLIGHTPKLTFMMQSNLVLQANIIPNPFTQLAGTYNGLVGNQYGRAQESSGFFTLAVTAKGAYSGSVKQGTNNYPFSGQFDGDGNATATVARRGTNAWVAAMMLDFAGQAVWGTVSNGVADGWVVNLYAEPAASQSTPVPDYAGIYTLAIPGLNNWDSTIALGDGYATITVATNGRVSLSGSLADGTALNLTSSQNPPISLYGAWPLYVPLYNGKGSVWGWVLSNGSAPAPSLSWIKPANSASAYYPGGFTDECELPVSPYLYARNIPVLDLTNGVIVFSGGDLAVPVSNEVLLTATNQFVNLGPNPMALTLNPTNGVLSGWFTVPGVAKTNRFNGVLLQQGYNEADGYFLGTSQSGQMLLMPVP